jgi:hypothetical protein
MLSKTVFDHVLMQIIFPIVFMVSVDYSYFYLCYFLTEKGHKYTNRLFLLIILRIC